MIITVRCHITFLVLYHAFSQLGIYRLDLNLASSINIVLTINLHSVNVGSLRVWCTYSSHTTSDVDLSVIHSIIVFLSLSHICFHLFLKGWMFGKESSGRERKLQSSSSPSHTTI